MDILLALDPCEADSPVLRIPELCDTDPPPEL
jgi:hypothetical protein